MIEEADDSGLFGNGRDGYGKGLQIVPVDVDNGESATHSRFLPRGWLTISCVSQEPGIRPDSGPEDNYVSAAARRTDNDIGCGLANLVNGLTRSSKKNISELNRRVRRSCNIGRDTGPARCDVKVVTRI